MLPIGHGFTGPRRDGTSAEKGLLRTWPKEGPKVLWTAPVGVGFGGPAVSGGKVYLLDRDEKVGDTLRVFDFSTGKELWSFAYDAPGSFMFPGSRTTPTVDGDLVYTCGPLGDLYAISTSTHKPVWHKNIWKDFGGAVVCPSPHATAGIRACGPATRAAPPDPRRAAWRSRRHAPRTPGDGRALRLAALPAVLPSGESSRTR